MPESLASDSFYVAFRLQACLRAQSQGSKAVWFRLPDCLTSAAGSHSPEAAGSSFQSSGAQIQVKPHPPFHGPVHVSGSFNICSWPSSSELGFRSLSRSRLGL